MSLSTRLAKLERQAPPPSATPEQIEQLAAGLSELQERAKREPWLQEHVDALFAFMRTSIPDRRSAKSLRRRSVGSKADLGSARLFDIMA